MAYSDMTEEQITREANRKIDPRFKLPKLTDSDGLIDVTPKPEAGCYVCDGPIQHDAKSGAYVCINDKYEYTPWGTCPRYGLLSIVTNRSRETVVSEKP